MAAGRIFFPAATALAEFFLQPTKLTIATNLAIFFIFDFSDIMVLSAEANAFRGTGKF